MVLNNGDGGYYEGGDDLRGSFPRHGDKRTTSEGRVALCPLHVQCCPSAGRPDEAFFQGQWQICRYGNRRVLMPSVRGALMT